MNQKPPQDTESRHADKYIVRFPDGMRDRLKDAAKAANRTLNAEIVARLETSFQAAQPAGEADRLVEFAKLLEGLKGQQAMTAEELKRIGDLMESGQVTLVPVGTAKVTKAKKQAD